MNKLKYLAVAIASAFFVGVFGIQNVHADSPRYDMIDVSNHNGAMSADEFRYMRDNYGVKAVTTKISEGTTYSDWTAPGNIQAAKDAGLYINGYAYIHSTTVQGAIAEADYAVVLHNKLDYQLAQYWLLILKIQIKWQWVDQCKQL